MYGRPSRGSSIRYTCVASLLSADDVRTTTMMMMNRVFSPIDIYTHQLSSCYSLSHSRYFLRAVFLSTTWGFAFSLSYTRLLACLLARGVAALSTTTKAITQRATASHNRPRGSRTRPIRAAGLASYIYFITAAQQPSDSSRSSCAGALAQF